MSSDPPQPSVRTARLLLRAMKPDDRDEFIRIHRVSVDFWRPWTPATRPDEPLEQLFERTLEDTQRGELSGSRFRLIGELRDGRIAGIFSLSEIVRGVFQNAYAGWRVSADSAGQGIATEGVRGLLDLAFASPPWGLALHRVQANIIPTNVASLRVAEKCGFRREGYAERYLQIAGQWQDHIMFAKTVEEHAVVHFRE